MVAKYCAPDVVAGFDLFFNFRRDTVAGLQNTLLAEAFEGTCPLAGH